MNKENYEWNSLFKYLDDMKTSIGTIEKDVRELRNTTHALYDEIRSESYKEGITNAFESIRDSVIDDYAAR